MKKQIMKENNNNIFALLQKALASQIEMGQSDIIINPDNLKVDKNAPEISIHNQSKAVVSTESAIASKLNKPVSMFSSLADHNNQICNCKLCPLGETRNKFVYGVGNPNADIMFIGEAPGADEDRLGEPFVGRCGQLLDKILAAIQLSRQTVYIANILKCRPPDNRDPQPDEMAKCFPYLHEQIRIVKPKLICALGRIAAQAVLDTTVPLGKLRRQWHQFEGVPTLITYHPAALLRFASYKRDTWEDMKMLKAKYESLT
jgi:DNA polymerase